MERIKGIGKHVGVLERRSEYLRRRIEGGGLRESAVVFEERELKAIDAGCEALQLAKRYQDSGTSPVLALEELVEAFDDHSNRDHGSTEEVERRLREGIAHARAVLAMIDASGD